MQVLFVCLGNICRSPTAEGVLRHKLRQAGLAEQVEVASAGTSDWHVGKPRMLAASVRLWRGATICRRNVASRPAAKTSPVTT